ncbi:hypothetical protein GJ496_002429 [Pomphorhynchus laevis]|nr:hypothetical protein GJ496_002429 [Pomphorhynchus laevis]
MLEDRDLRNSLKTAVVFSQCILQSFNSNRISDKRRSLERRLALWNQAKFSELFDDASYLQQQLNRNVQSRQQDWLKLYRKLMTKCKLRAATSVLEDVFAGTLKHDSLIDGVPVKKILMSLHPEAIQPGRERYY